MIRKQNLSQTDLAKKLNISRVRITQIMNLRKLAPWITKYIKKHPETHFFERQLRPLTSIESANIQIRKFRKLIKE